MVPRYEIRLSGSGGQGLILAGTILAEAIALHEQKYVVQSQSYGPEARGTASKADVIISDEAIDYPKSINPDVLLAMNQKALDINFLDLKKGGGFDCRFRVGQGIAHHPSDLLTADPDRPGGDSKPTAGQYGRFGGLGGLHPKGFPSGPFQDFNDPFEKGIVSGKPKGP